MSNWTPYNEQKPAKAGTYLWRVESKHLPGMFVIFRACMRMRGNGHKPNILSPVFDYWDGYKVTVPKGVEWKPSDGEPLRPYETDSVDIEGVSNIQCLFCHKTPAWHGCLQRGSGIVINASPHEYNKWWLTCCGYAQTPPVADPRELADYRNKTLQGSGD